MSELKCRCSGISECSSDVEERSLHEQVIIPLCSMHLEQLSLVRMPVDWNEAEEEDYQYYLDNINKATVKDDDFDALDILEGKLPKLETSLAKHKCAIVLGRFIRQTNISFTQLPEYAASLATLAEQLGLVHRTLLMKHFTIQQIESIMRLEHKEWLAEIASEVLSENQ